MGEVPSKRHPRVAVYRGQKPVVVEEYLTDVFTDEAISFIERHRNEPFFLYLSFTAPHTPLQATAEYLDRYRHIEDPGTRIYAAMVASLDDSVAAVIAELKEIGQYENTLVVFLSDNGCAGHIDGACSNAPHAGFKGYHQEGGIRVPFIMSWPETLPAGTTYDDPVISLDLLSTFTAAAGSPVVAEDSVDLLPYLTGELDGAPHDYLYWRSGPTVAIRDDRWKLILYNKTPLTPADLRADGSLEPPNDGWATDSPYGQLELLYDLRADPGETTNVAETHPEAVARLKAAHAEWATELPAQPILPGRASMLEEMDGEAVQLIY